MQVQSAGRTSIWIHILVGILFLLLPALFAPRPAGEPFFNLSNPTLRDVLSNLIMIVFFYANYYFFIPHFYLRKKHLLYWAIVVVAFITIVFLPSLITGFVPWKGVPPMPREHNGGAPMMPEGTSFITSIYHVILLFVSVVLFSILLKVRERLYASEKAKDKMELIALRDLINPHFLFNVLNNIYSQAIEDHSEKTASSIVKLSHMMRYVVHKARAEFVPLAQELEYLDNYIDLQRERLDESIEVRYRKEVGQASDLLIAPLLLIPFVENAFKHGINADEPSLIEVNISLSDQTLSMQVKNRQVAITPAPHEISGKGISTTRERLLFLYPDKHQLILEDIPDHFRVYLQIQLDVKGHSH